MESKGSIFKSERGFSKTQKRLMTKHNIKPSKEGLEELRLVTRVRRKKEKLVQKKKHAEAQEYLRTNGKERKSKHKGRVKGGNGKYRKVSVKPKKEEVKAA